MAIEFVKLDKGDSVVSSVGSYGFFKLMVKSSSGGGGETPTFSRAFSENSPETISQVSALISANNMTSAEVESTFGWSFDDTKDIALSTGEVIQMRIIGFNHDDKSDGAGKAGITLQMVNCLAKRYPMNSSNTNAGGYAASKMKTSTLPTIKALLPQEWQDVIKLVDKKSANGGSSNYSETLTTSDDLFLLSTKEVFGGGASSTQDIENEGDMYEYYEAHDTSNDRRKKYDADADGIVDTATAWWLRSCPSTRTDYFRRVSVDGASGHEGASVTRGVSFAFCV